VLIRQPARTLPRYRPLPIDIKRDSKQRLLVPPGRPVGPASLGAPSKPPLESAAHRLSGAEWIHRASRDMLGLLVLCA